MAEIVTLSLGIPSAAFSLMASGVTPKSAYCALVEQGQTTVMAVLTFGFLNTPITHNGTGEVAGYVTLWPNRNVTVIDAVGRLLGVVEKHGNVTSEQAVEMFDRFWMEEQAQ